MSSLLEEAIVDAKALKEAALKNAENVVLEKYSAEIKGALSTLLEQDELGLGLDEGDEEGDADASFTDDVPYAFQTEELDAPADNELIEIDFDSLKARIEEETAAGVEASPDSLIDATDLAADLGEPPAEVASELTESDDDSPDITEKTNLEEDEDVALTEEMIADLIEELVVDMTPRPQGWASVNSADNSVEQANNNAMGLAQAAQLDEDEEELEEDASTAPDVVSDAALYESKISELTESLKGLHALLNESKTQLTKLNLENAKLVYQNKALSSTSLNERQKDKIVEAVQLANSVEEAQVLFETIQNAVGVAGSKSTRPQTLREAVQRPVSLLINSKKNNEATRDPNMDRMLRLAGLTKQ
tara:strand:+ start:5876 stop:6961 length:1086 start_codon:yes stop_codon:yes gene_type:complete